MDGGHAVAVIESKVKNAKLTFTLISAEESPPTVEAAPQTNACKIVPKANEEGDALEMLSGDGLGVDSTTGYTLEMAGIPDWTNKDGFVQFAWDYDGKLATVVFDPCADDETGPTYTGTVRVGAIAVGGDAGKRSPIEATWSLVSKPERAYKVKAMAPEQTSAKKAGGEI
jgi:hypothetical protein